MLETLGSTTPGNWKQMTVRAENKTVTMLHIHPSHCGSRKDLVGDSADDDRP